VETQAQTSGEAERGARPDRRRAAEAWFERHGPLALLAAALLASGALVVALCWNLTFFQDSWAFLLDRQGYSADSFLAPHNEHIVVLPVLVNKVLLELFGMTSGRPEMFAMTATLLASGALLFVYVRRRVGPWLALLAALLLLFLGAAWPVLLWPFEIEFSGAVMAGIAMLLLLDRDDGRGDAWACLLLTISIAFGSLGLSFAAAALVDVFQKRRSRGWRRLYVAVVPLFLYVVWYAGWGHTAEHHLTLVNVLMSPQYLFDGFSSALDSLAGLSSIPVNGPGQPEWGRPLLVAAIGLTVYCYRRKPLSPGFWPVAAAGVSYWLLAAFNFVPGREAAASRYVYAGAAFVLLIAAELLRGVRFSRRGLWIAAGVTALAIAPNLAQMKAGADWLKEQSILTRADTAGIEIASRTVAPSFGLTPEISGTGSLFIVEAGPYREAVEEFGSPAYSPEELDAAPEVGRHWADVVLSKALPISFATYDGDAGSAASAACVTIPGGDGPRPDVQMPFGATKVELAPGPPANLSLRRFSVDEYPVPLGSPPGESVTAVRVPRDKAPGHPWYLHVEAQQRVRVCR
jgi:hypothetical protein